MARIGFDKRTTAEKTKAEQVKHAHVPGVAYEVSDPTVKLIGMVAGGFFNEPRYYDASRPYNQFYHELLTTGKITSAPVDEKTGLTNQARELLETAQAVANGSHPEDLLIIASWLRDTKDGMKLRTTPQILLALAAANPKTKEFVRKYTTAIVKRADEIRQVFAAYRHLFNYSTPYHKGTLPHGLRKGLAQAFQEFSVYDLLKYDGTDRPTFADVLLMISGSKKLPKRQRQTISNNERRRYQAQGILNHRDGWPLSKSLFEWLVNRKITDDAPGMIRNRKAFFTMKNLDGLTTEMIKEAGLTWENVKSKAGQIGDDDEVKLDAKVWEICIPIMGEMAIIRNLRNMEQAGISRRAWDMVYEKLEKIEKTNQLPFRFFAAEQEVKSTEAKTAVALLLDQACANLPDLPGTTLVLADNSGSAVGAVVSGNSKMKVSDAGNTLQAVLAKRLGRRAIVGVFGDSLIWVPFSQADSCLTIKRKIDSIARVEERSKNGALAISSYKYGAGVGHATETGLWWAIHDITERKVHVDRIIILSDLCCYTQGDARSCWYSAASEMVRTFGPSATIQSMIDRYKRTVNKDVWTYSVNLHGYSQAQLRPTEGRTGLLSGWSENVFRTMSDLENGTEVVQTVKGEKVREIPTIEVLRRRYHRV